MSTMIAPTTHTPTLRERAVDVYLRVTHTIDDMLESAPQAERDLVVIPEVDEIEDLLERARWPLDIHSGEHLAELFDRLDMLVLP